MAKRGFSRRSAAPAADIAPAGPGLAQAPDVSAGGTPGGLAAAGPLPRPPDAAGASRLVWPLLTAALATLVLVTLPRLPLGTDDDSAWGAVLGYAHQKGLQFGADIVFTYGPLGFLITPYLCPQAPGLRLLADLGLSFLSVTGYCLLAWRSAALWRWFSIGALLFLAGNAEPRSELLLNLGLLSWSLLCVVASGRSAAATVAVLIGLSIFCALAKVSYLFIAPLGLAAVACDFLLRGRTRWGLGVLAGFAGGLGLAWVSLGQAPTHLASFLANSLALSSGYHQAMQVKDFPTLTRTALLMLATATFAVVLRAWTTFRPAENRFHWRRLIVLFWLSGWLFLIWKHGFVRAGRDHTEIYLACVPLMTLLLEALPGTVAAAHYAARGLAFVTCLLAGFGLQWLFAGDFKGCFVRPVQLTGEHIEALLHPRAYHDRLSELQDAEASAMQLPRLRDKIQQSSVDVFGFNQSYAVFNPLNYRPRPIFQSYAAYSRRLMELNEQYYLSSAAPDYVLFHLSAIDDRFPPLEDALVFRNLLQSYTPVDAEGPFLLLKSRRIEPARLKLLYSGELAPGQLINLTSYGEADLWLDLHIEPSLKGRAQTLLYQASPPELGVWCRAGVRMRMAKFRAPAPMLDAGFLASPLLLEDQDVLDLYTGTAITRPVAYSVELGPETRAYWETNIECHIYQLETQLGHSAPPELSRLLKYPGFDVAPAAIVSPTNAILQVRNQPALFLPPGSYMRFAVPQGASVVKGSFGFAPAAYSLGGATEGAEFRIEEELPDGSMRLLTSRILRPSTNPDDRGLQPFVLACPGEGERQLLFRILPVAQEHPTWDLTCWAGIGFR